MLIVLTLNLKKNESVGVFQLIGTSYMTAEEKEQKY